MMRKILTAILMVVSASFNAYAGKEEAQATCPELCDSLTIWIERRTGVNPGIISVRNLLYRKGVADIYFSGNLAQAPWRKEDIDWMRGRICSFFSEKTQTKFTLGKIYCLGIPFEELPTPIVGNNGQYQAYRFVSNSKPNSTNIVREDGAEIFPLGMSGRHIALWQSHGRYFNEKENRWKWQRAPVHRTVEDLYTQSYVLQFLIPMLENAGAYVMTPRERDTNSYELVIDNDSQHNFEEVRRHGEYTEKGNWKMVEGGFADLKPILDIGDNPFTWGTSRKTACTGNRGKEATATWAGPVAKPGMYAVYVSYQTFPGSCKCAEYTVRHAGGESRILVDQSKGGATWMYLGTFEFYGKASVTLSNYCPDGKSGNVVCADAVRIGGGMGKVGRGADGEDIVSGYPAYCEGALYNLVWSGFDKSLWEEWDDDYTRDYAARGVWVKDLKKRGIPVDLSLAFHTDAGTMGRDSTVGTLAIYTSKAEGKRKMSDGTDRMTSRLLADFVQTQVVNDIRADFEPLWQRRGTADRSYSESRTTDTPAIILELLSHQNFADMRYGWDPDFRFTVSRAVYKGILKYLSAAYRIPYVVQPLPVRAFASRLDGNGVLELSWKETADPKEPTARAESYIVYTRMDGGAFDKGVKSADCRMSVRLEKGHVYSFKVCAVNKGGISFPSEILSAGLPEGETRANALVVNAFTELRSPVCIEDEHIAGFMAREDSGVPFGEELCYIGENYNFDRASKWVNDSEAGFGASFISYAGKKVAGNSFDYPYLHVAELIERDIAVCSCSLDAFVEGGWRECCATVDSCAVACDSAAVSPSRIVDVICGKQRNIFDGGMLDALEASGCDIVISGSEIGTSTRCEADSLCIRDRVKCLLGFSWTSSHATCEGLVGGKAFASKPNPDRFCVESPDAIDPALPEAYCPFRYDESMENAAVYMDKGGRRTVAFGFPLEALLSEEDFRFFLGHALDFILSED